MDSKTFFTLVLATYITLVSLESATGRSHGLKYHHHHHSHPHNSNHNRNHQNHHPHSFDNTGEGQERNTVPKQHVKSTSTSWRQSDDDYEDEEDYGGRHAYLMTRDNKKSSSNERVSEDQTLTSAFEKHMKPGSPNIHDVYAYQLPSDLWFIVRYSKNEDGQVEKYMNVVDSFTNYLEKLDDKDVRTVSVNVKGVETG